MYRGLDRNKVPAIIKHHLFNSFVRSHLIFASNYMINLRKNIITPLFRSFKKIYNYIFNKKINEKYLIELFNTNSVRFLNKILVTKKPNKSYLILRDYLSGRKTNYFLLYKKPKIQLTFFYNLLSIYNDHFRNRLFDQVDLLLCAAVN